MEITVAFLPWLALALALLGVAILASSARASRNRIALTVKSLPDFSASICALSDDRTSGIAYDEERRKISILRRVSNRIEARVFDYSDLICAEILENDVTSERVARMFQPAYAVVDLSQVRGEQDIKPLSVGERRLDLLVVAKDTRNSVYRVSFLAGKAARDPKKYDESRKKASEWLGRLHDLMRRADAEEAVRQQAAKTPISQEIQNLVNLLKQGLISDSEFHEARDHLISKRISV